jgi:hypothetical protein
MKKNGVFWILVTVLIFGIVSVSCDLGINGNGDDSGNIGAGDGSGNNGVGDGSGNNGAGNGSGNNGSNTTPGTVTYTSRDVNGNTYKLVITETINARYVGKTGDSYVLTIWPADGGASKTSTGTVTTGEDCLVLTPTGATVTFTITLNSGSIDTISGTITFDDGDTKNLGTDGITLSSADPPVIDNITISAAADGNDTIITLVIDVISNVPVDWLSGSFYGPNGNIWGGGGGRSFTEVATNLWRFTHTDRVSQYAPSGEYYYSNMNVSNAGQLDSEPWAGELKVTVINVGL